MKYNKLMIVLVMAIMSSTAKPESTEREVSTVKPEPVDTETTTVSTKTRAHDLVSYQKLMTGVEALRELRRVRKDEAILINDLPSLPAEAMSKLRNIEKAVRKFNEDSYVPQGSTLFNGRYVIDVTKSLVSNTFVTAYEECYKFPGGKLFEIRDQNDARFLSTNRSIQAIYQNISPFLIDMNRVTYKSGKLLPEHMFQRTLKLPEKPIISREANRVGMDAKECMVFQPASATFKKEGCTLEAGTTALCEIEPNAINALSSKFTTYKEALHTVLSNVITGKIQTLWSRAVQQLPESCELVLSNQKVVFKMSEESHIAQFIEEVNPSDFMSLAIATERHIEKLSLLGNLDEVEKAHGSFFKVLAGPPFRGDDENMICSKSKEDRTGDLIDITISSLQAVANEIGDLKVVTSSSEDPMLRKLLTERFKDTTEQLQNTEEDMLATKKSLEEFERRLDATEGIQHNQQLSQSSLEVKLDNKIEETKHSLTLFERSTANTLDRLSHDTLSLSQKLGQAEFELNGIAKSVSKASSQEEDELQKSDVLRYMDDFLKLDREILPTSQFMGVIEIIKTTLLNDDEFVERLSEETARPDEVGIEKARANRNKEGQENRHSNDLESLFDSDKISNFLRDKMVMAILAGLALIVSAVNLIIPCIWQCIRKCKPITGQADPYNNEDDSDGYMNGNQNGSPSDQNPAGNHRRTTGPTQNTNGARGTGRDYNQQSQRNYLSAVLDPRLWLGNPLPRNDQRIPMNTMSGIRQEIPEHRESGEEDLENSLTPLLTGARAKTNSATASPMVTQGEPHTPVADEEPPPYSVSIRAPARRGNRVTFSMDQDEDQVTITRGNKQARIYNAFQVIVANLATLQMENRETEDMVADLKKWSDRLNFNWEDVQAEKRKRVDRMRAGLLSEYRSPSNDIQGLVSPIESSRGNRQHTMRVDASASVPSEPHESLESIQEDVERFVDTFDETHEDVRYSPRSPFLRQIGNGSVILSTDLNPRVY